VAVTTLPLRGHPETRDIPALEVHEVIDEVVQCQLTFTFLLSILALKETVIAIFMGAGYGGFWHIVNENVWPLSGSSNSL